MSAELWSDHIGEFRPGIRLADLDSVETSATEKTVFRAQNSLLRINIAE